MNEKLNIIIKNRYIKNILSGSAYHLKKGFKKGPQTEKFIKVYNTSQNKI